MTDDDLRKLVQEALEAYRDWEEDPRTRTERVFREAMEKLEAVVPVREGWERL